MTKLPSHLKTPVAKIDLQTPDLIKQWRSTRHISHKVISVPSSNSKRNDGTVESGSLERSRGRRTKPTTSKTFSSDESFTPFTNSSVRKSIFSKKSRHSSPWSAITSTDEMVSRVDKLL